MSNETMCYYAIIIIIAYACAMMEVIRCVFAFSIILVTLSLTGAEEH